MKKLVLILLAWAGLIAGELSLPASPKKTVRIRATAYCPCEKCTDGDGITSIGDDAYVLDGVASDPKRLKYRTKLDIPGVGVKEVDDTGSAMKRGKTLRIDVRFRTHQEALDYGVKFLEATILE